MVDFRTQTILGEGIWSNEDIQRKEEVLELEEEIDEMCDNLHLKFGTSAVVRNLDDDNVIQEKARQNHQKFERYNMHFSSISYPTSHSRLIQADQIHKINKSIESLCIYFRQHFSNTSLTPISTY